MNNKSSSNEKHKRLVAHYVYCKFLYSLSLSQRINKDLGYAQYLIDLYPNDLLQLSEDELKRKLNSLRKPWWYNIYEKEIHGNFKRQILLNKIFGIWFKFRHPIIYRRNLRYIK